MRSPNAATSTLAAALSLLLAGPAAAAEPAPGGAAPPTSSPAPAAVPTPGPSGAPGSVPPAPAAPAVPAPGPAAPQSPGVAAPAPAAAVGVTAPPAGTPAGGAAPPAEAPRVRKIDKATIAEAKRLYGEGEAAYAASDFPVAIERFQAAQALIPSPQAAYWLALSLRAVGKVPEAIAELETLLGAASSARLGEEKLASARAALEELRRTPGSLALTTDPPGANVLVDGQPAPDLTPITLSLPPGPHKISISRTGYQTLELELDVPAGARGEQAVALPALPPPPPAPPPVAGTPPDAKVDEDPPPLPVAPGGGPRDPVPGWVLIGAGAAGVAAGAVFGGLALSAASRFDDRPSTSRADEVDRLALTSDIAYGAGITLGLAGLAWFLAPDAAEAAGTARIRFAPRVGTAGGGGAVRLAF